MSDTPQALVFLQFWNSTFTTFGITFFGFFQTENTFSIDFCFHSTPTTLCFSHAPLLAPSLPGRFWGHYSGNTDSPEPKKLTYLGEERAALLLAAPNPVFLVSGRSLVLTHPLAAIFHLLDCTKTSVSKIHCSFFFFFEYSPAESPKSRFL